MAGLRSYGDPCGIARALDLVGERWALLVIRELMFGPKRFTDLREGLSGASPNVLSQRLRELEEGSVIRRVASGGRAYELTEWGRELHPILVALGRWGARSAAPPRGALSPDALMVALEATFTGGWDAAAPRTVLEVRLGGDPFAVEVEQGALGVTRGAPRAPAATIVTDVATLRAVAFADRALAEAAVEIRGDRSVAERFLRSFARPTPNAPHR